MNIFAQNKTERKTRTESLEIEAKLPVIDFEEYDLPNGLHVILSQDNSLPIVSTNIHYHVGSKNESSTRTGFAHFFEHLMFEGTENINRGQIDKLISGAGGELNAGTSFDYTSYYFVLPSNQLELGLWIESERMRGNRIDEEGVETQRSVVKEERRARYDNQSYGDLYEQLSALVFKGTPYEWTPIGSFQYIDKASISEFREFYKKFYVPNNAVLTVVGDFKIEKVKLLIKKHFENIQPGNTITQPNVTFDLNTKGEEKVVKDKKTPLPLLLYAWKVPSRDHEDSYALDVLSKILSQGQSSRLYKSMVSEHRVASSIGVNSFQFEDVGTFLMYAVGNTSSTLEVLDKTLSSEIDSLIDYGISEFEFRKSINQILTSIAYSYRSNRSIASALGFYHTFYKDAGRINNQFENYKRLTIKDINVVAKKYFKPDRKNVVKYSIEKNHIDK